jgi:hypothetical protein
MLLYNLDIDERIILMWTVTRMWNGFKWIRDRSNGELL